MTAFGLQHSYDIMNVTIKNQSLIKSELGNYRSRLTIMQLFWRSNKIYYSNILQLEEFGICYKVFQIYLIPIPEKIWFFLLLLNEMEVSASCVTVHILGSIMPLVAILNWLRFIHLIHSNRKLKTVDHICLIRPHLYFSHLSITPGLIWCK